MTVPNCDRCGAAIDRVTREIDGKLADVYPKFCRKCGGTVILCQEVAGENDGVSAQTEAESQEKSFDYLANFDTLKRAIAAAIPENFTTLSREQLHESIIEAVARQICSTDVRQASGQEPQKTPSRELNLPRIPSRELEMPRAASRELEPRRIPSRELVSGPYQEERRARPSILSGKCSAATPRARDEHREERLTSYHVSSLAGLTSHVTWTPEEAQELGPQLAKRRYTIEPCDCDRVHYVPSETHPGFIRKAEDAVEK